MERFRGFAFVAVAAFPVVVAEPASCVLASSAVLGEEKPSRRLADEYVDLTCDVEGQLRTAVTGAQRRREDEEGNNQL